MNRLFEAYPKLRENLPHVSLASLPTPVERMERLETAVGEALGEGQLYVKRDDLSCPRYGGNKVRKLEFLLGKAAQGQPRTVITFGAAGSNHALATAIQCRELGLRPVSMLVGQPNARYVRKNLLMSHRVGTELHHAKGIPSVALSTLWQYARHTLTGGRPPLLVPVGGTSPVGLLGFVDAAFELKHQIEAGELPEPAVLYAASGTMGTVVGLMLGISAAGLRTRVVAVRVTDPQFTSMKKARRLFRGANDLLTKADPGFPRLPFPESEFTFRHEYYGDEYARYTEAGMQAVAEARDEGGIQLEGTYTGKTFAALLDDARSGALKDQTVLFWNTYNSADFSEEIEDMDYHALPKAFHRYFEEDVQPLDR